MSEPWKARFPRIATKVNKICKRYSELMKMAGMKAADASRIVISPAMDNLLQCQIVPKAGSIAFDIARIGRIKQPRSGALLAKYANAFARDAFEHDLTRRPGKKTSVSPNNQNLQKETALAVAATEVTPGDTHLEQALKAVVPEIVEAVEPDSPAPGTE